VRTQAALAAANARRRRLRTPDPAGAVERMRVARKAQAAQFAANVLPIIRDIQAAGHNVTRGDNLWYAIAFALRRSRKIVRGLKQELSYRGKSARRACLLRVPDQLDQMRTSPLTMASAHS
jgi:hypothetical protein